MTQNIKSVKCCFETKVLNQTHKLLLLNEIGLRV